MKISPQYRIFEACHQGTPQDYWKNFVYVARAGHWPWLTTEFITNFGSRVPGDMYTNNGVAWATDGIILAMVPVRLEPADVPGPVHWEIFQREQDDSRGFTGTLRLFPSVVGLSSGATYPRFGWNTYGEDIRPPRIDRFFPVARPRVPVGSGSMTLNMWYMSRLARAIGSTESGEGGNFRFVSTAESNDKTVVVEPAGKTVNTDWTGLPLGLIMPVNSMNNYFNIDWPGEGAPGSAEDGEGDEEE